ncbi:MAG: twin-arginine translocation signal domain-containing protein [Fuerstiella sp.]
MESTGNNRRDFLKRSATAAAIGTGLASAATRAAAMSEAEVQVWQSRVGSCFQVGDAELQLRSVSVADNSKDPARPAHLRTHTVSLFFVLISGHIDTSSQMLNDGRQQLSLTQVCPPQGEASKQFFEAILN